MKNLKIIIFSLFLLLSFSAHKAEAAVTLQLSALNISGLTSTGTATLPTFSLNISTNDLSDFSSTAVFGINIFNTYNSTTQSFSGNAGSGAITVQTGVLQQTKTIAITQPLTNNSIYFARVFYNKGTNLDFVYSNVVSFKFGDSTSVNNNFSPASYITDPLSNGYTPVVLTNNNSGTESGEWWFKPTKDGEVKGGFSSIAECEIERAKGNSYSKQCFQFYYPLAPLPGQADKIDTSSSGDSDCPFGNYLNILIKLFIGICAVLAMIKIVLGGMQYMTSELSSGKEDGKNSITSAVFGLILALGAFAILNTINPELLKVCLNNLPKATVLVQDDSIQQTAIDGKYCMNTAGGPYNANLPWNDTTAGVIPNLPVNVSVSPTGDCTGVGQNSCTSLHGLNPIAINSIRNDCALCDIVITAGTECWLHGGSKQNTDHHPNANTVDLRATPSLNEYVTGSQNFPNNAKWYTKNGIHFLSEQAGQTSSTTAKHWHVKATGGGGGSW
jgi:hypothetical protein